MTFYWNERRMELFKRASAITGFHVAIAAGILKELDEPGRRHITDLGCGLGLLDLELAGSVRGIRAIDVEPRVIDSLKADAAAMGIDNIDAETADLYADRDAVLGDGLDVLVMSYFGHPDEDLLDFMRRAEVTVIVTNSSMRAGDPRPCATDFEAFLRESGINFSANNMLLQFGQPLADLNEARTYAQEYEREYVKDAVLDIRSFKLYGDADPAYPLYVPKLKDMCIFTVPGEGVRRSGTA